MQYPPIDNNQPPLQPWQQPSSSQYLPSFYQQPTSQYQPGQFQPPPSFHNPPPHPPKKPLPSIWLVIGVAVGALLLCGICGAIGSAIGNTSSTTQQPIPTIPPTSPALLAVVTSTPKATATLKPKPTATATPKPTATPIQPTSAQTRPTPTPTPTPQHTGVNGNPWGYDFNPGKYIYIPPSTFCNYFNCIPTFYAPDDPGDGYIIECQDSTYSQSGSERGACSSHGGELRPLYSH